MNTLSVLHAVVFGRVGPVIAAQVGLPGAPVGPQPLKWWQRSPGVGVALFVASRLVVLPGLLVAMSRRHGGWHRLAELNDGWWYLHIAAHGYESTLRPRGVDAFHARFSTWAFYPGFPLAVRAVHATIALPFAASGFVVAALFGCTAVVAVAALTAHYGGAPAALNAAALFAFWPGSAVLSLPYSEGLFVTAAAVSLLALARRAWWLAGVSGFVATGTRALGLALIAAAAVAAVQEVRRNREWAAFVAPVLTAAGAGAFYLYGWLRTGDALVWRHSEDLWRQRFDFGSSVLWHFAHDLVTGDRREPTTLLLLLGVVGLAVAAACAARSTSPHDPALLVFAVVSVVLLLGYGHVGPRPRMVLAVVPAFVWAGVQLRRRSVLVGMAPMAVLLAATAYAYGTSVVP